MKVRSKYDESLERLDAMIAQMGQRVVTALEGAMTAWEKQDRDLARQIMDQDDQINSQEKQIEQLCLELLLRQQPVAGDLRRVSAILKMVTDLERIGDHARDIAEVSLHMGSPADFPKWHGLVKSMAHVSREMILGALEAGAQESIALARTVASRDNEVDQDFAVLKQQLAESLAQQPGRIDEILDWLMLSKYLERVADHAVNISEWVEFRLTGSYKNTQVL